jgi:hypothetical protein
MDKNKTILCSVFKVIIVIFCIYSSILTYLIYQNTKEANYFSSSFALTYIKDDLKQIKERLGIR